MTVLTVQASLNLFRYLDTIIRVVDEREESLPTSLEGQILAGKLAEYLLLWRAGQGTLAICLCSLAGRFLTLLETDLRDPKLSMYRSYHSIQFYAVTCYAMHCCCGDCKPAVAALVPST